MASNQGKGCGYQNFVSDGLERAPLLHAVNESAWQFVADLRALVSEGFFHLFHKGYIAPDAPDAHLNPPQMRRFNVAFERAYSVRMGWNGVIRLFYCNG